MKDFLLDHLTCNTITWWFIPSLPNIEMEMPELRWKLIQSLQFRLAQIIHWFFFWIRTISVMFQINVTKQKQKRKERFYVGEWIMVHWEWGCSWASSLVWDRWSALKEKKHGMLRCMNQSQKSKRAHRGYAGYNRYVRSRV